MKSISLIGGSGFIGSRLIDKLLGQQQYSVLNYDKRASEKYNSITTIADITDEALFETKLAKSDYVVLLAAEHRDDVTPTSLYYDVNIGGTKSVLRAMDKVGINKIIFTSSVAVYGLNKECPDETSETDPFNHYGKSKFEAEGALREWHAVDPENRTLIILRPTVVFGPNNKGNVYNLLMQIAKGKFLMIGKGVNKKSMSYVDNIVGFMEYIIANNFTGYHLYNYADKPDLTTNDLLKTVEKATGKKLPPFRIPYFIGYLAGLLFDTAAKITGKKFSISRVRIKKFCSTTEFSSAQITKTGYIPAITLQKGIEITIKDIQEKNKF